MRQLVECVPNFSEGRDAGKIDAIVQTVLAVTEVVLLDREADADHNRSVLTFAGPPAAVAEAAFHAVEQAVALIDLTKHQGSFETRPIPMKMAITTPNSDTAVSPRLTTTKRSTSIEIPPTRIEAPESSSANAIRLYRTRSRTASRKVLKAI